MKSNLTCCIFCLLLLMFAQCARKTVIKTDSGRIKVKTKEKIKVQKIDIKQLSSKAKIEYTDGLEQFTANANIRMKLDSVIWVSVTPGLGIEALRCLVNRDSVWVINKLNKESYSFSFADLSKKLNFEINFNLLQSVLLGNMPYEQIDSDSIVVDSTYNQIIQIRKNITAINYIHLGSNQLQSLSMKDYGNGNMLNINFSNFLPLDGFSFPNTNKLSIRYRAKEGFENTYLGIEHKKIDTSDQNLKFPFSIPNRFDKKK